MKLLLGYFVLSFSILEFSYCGNSKNKHSHSIQNISKQNMLDIQNSNLSAVEMNTQSKNKGIIYYSFNRDEILDENLNNQQLDPNRKKDIVMNAIISSKEIALNNSRKISSEEHFPDEIKATDASMSMKELNKKIMSLGNRKSELSTEIENLKSCAQIHFDKIQKDIDTLKLEIRFKTAQTEITNNAIAALTEEILGILKEHKSEKNNWNSLLNAFRSNNSDKQSKVFDMKSLRIDDLATNMTNFFESMNGKQFKAEDYQDAIQKLNEKKIKLEDMKKNILRSEENLKSQLADNNDMHTKKINASEKLIEALKTGISDFNEIEIKVSSHLNEIAESLNIEKGKLNVQKLDEINSKQNKTIDNLQKEIQKNDAILENLNTEKKSFESLFDKTCKECSDLQQENEKLQSECKDLEIHRNQEIENWKNNRK